MTPASLPTTPRAFSGHVGVARQDITPPTRIYSRSWGAANHDVADGIHRPLTLTCLTFQESPQSPPLVLFAADLGWWKSLEDEQRVRQRILRDLKLEPFQYMLCFSHTHAGPSLSTENDSKPGGNLIAPYLDHLRDAAICAAKSALSSAQSALLSWRYDKCTLAANRDLPEPARQRFVVGCNPTQPADDTLLIGRVTTPDHKLLATLVNYACHPTTLAWDNHLLSPDYVGAMREVIECHTQAPCLFFQGASGELAPAEQYVGDISVAETHGRRLGYAVLSASEGMLPADQHLGRLEIVESGAPLGVWKRATIAPSKVLAAEKLDVDLPLKNLPPLAEIERLWRNSTDRTFKERYWRERAVRKIVGDGSTSRVEVWLWRLGDAIVVGQPTETYSRFQIELRRRLAPHPAAVMNLVNGHIGYLPPAGLYGEKLYQVWQTPYASGSLERLIDATAEGAQRLLARQ
jgi:hypothetical protein